MWLNISMLKQIEKVAILHVMMHFYKIIALKQQNKNNLKEEETLKGAVN